MINKEWQKGQEVNRLKNLFTLLPFSLLALFALYSSLFTAVVWAQADLYPFPRLEEDAKVKKEKRKKAVDPFVQVLSRKMEISEKLAEDGMSKGLGRSEIVRLILLSKKSGKPLEELAKMREKGIRFSKIAEEAGQDNRSIKKEAEKILKELEKELEKIKQELSAGATTVAGISEESLTKKATVQLEKKGGDAPR